jgi:CheY-like chemotaxis protein
MKVLAVDDDLTILELLRETLALFGHEDIFAVASGEEALALIDREEQPFDCMLFDIQMPGMDGITLCREVRARKAYARTPILMLTAMSQRDYVERAFTAGASDYVTKPFDFLELASRLRMAEKLVQERHLVNDGLVALENLRREITTTQKHSLYQPIDLPHVPRAIGYTAFENYILQLTRGSQFTSTVFATKIAGINQLHAAASASEFLHVLNSVGRAISDCTEDDGSLLSYRGAGVFVSVSHNRPRLSQLDLELHINDHLIRSQEAQGRDKLLKVAVGERASLGAITRFGSLQAIHRAISSAERKLGDAAPSFAAPSSQRPAAAQPQAERTDRAIDMNRFAFEALLRDALNEEITAIRR